MLRELQQGNVGISILQEAKLNGGIHRRYSAGCRVWETEAESRHRGGIAVVCREAAGWQVEGVTHYGPNVVSFKIYAGWNHWYVVGAYMPPNNQLAVHRVE